MDAPGHLNGVVELTFSGRALARGAQPAWDGASCQEVACHGARLADPSPFVPSWRDASGAARACGACHGIPPVQHTASTDCERSSCHGGEVVREGSAPAISPAGSALHVDGVIESGR
jgi:predicted CxxxxCH...CXXCH cytochrome family protein